MTQRKSRVGEPTLKLSNCRDLTQGQIRAKNSGRKDRVKAILGAFPLFLDERNHFHSHSVFVFSGPMSRRFIPTQFADRWSNILLTV